MFSKQLLRIFAFAGTIGVAQLALLSGASSGSTSSAENETSYAPIQSVPYDFGSKSMSGYFVQRSSVCRITLMIAERSDPDRLMPTTATRVRLVLIPGQIAGLDSEEGRSLNLKCGEGASTLTVDYGERAKLIALQDLSVTSAMADQLEAQH